MPISRAWLPALALMAPLALVQPAHADTAPGSHHGVAFAAPKGAKARIVEPDGRIVTSDGVSDLVAPASIASREAHSAIARLINAAAVDKAAAVQTLQPDAADSADAPKAAPRHEANRGLKFGSVTPGV